MVFLQLYININIGSYTYIINIWSLGTEVIFRTTSTWYPETTFKILLEDLIISKLFWDYHIDFEALYY